MIANVNLAHFTDRRDLFKDRIPLSAVRTVLTDRKMVNTYSCHENILSPTNEMRFTERKTLFTERIHLLSIRSSVRIDKPYITTLAMKIFYVPLIRCDLRTVKHTLQNVYPCGRFVRSVRIDTWIIRTVTLRVYWTTLRKNAP